MATPEEQVSEEQVSEGRLPEGQRSELASPEPQSAPAATDPYVDRAGWLANAGRPELIDEIADVCERSMGSRQGNESGRERFWSRESPGWPNESPGWPSRAAS